MEVAKPAFGRADHATWRMILGEHRQRRDGQLCDIFLKGVDLLGITDEAIPDIDAVNAVLKARTGYRGVYVDGFEQGSDFFPMLVERKFPVGNFIRDSKDINYTPAPDVVHDLYGHLPFYTDKAYADFCHDFGVEACKYLDRPALLRQFERFFWFTCEFGLVKTAKGLRIFGAGIASSIGECQYALSDKPQVVPFDVDAIRHQEFRIDVMQSKLFCLESPGQLYGSLGELARKVGRDSAAA